jgi:D-alanyl-lipoteichoic acid acyltransferase DltB (MBOAT superfamily)
VTLAQIAILICTAVVIGRMRRGRELALLAASTAALFWLQPAEPFPTLGFWLPYGTLALTTACWALTTGPDLFRWREVWPAALVLVGVVLLVKLNSILGPPLNAAVTAPSFLRLLLGLIATGGLVLVLWRWNRVRRWALLMVPVLIIAVFAVFKAPGLTEAAARGLQALVAAGTDTVIEAPLSWLGYSYVAFRLLHTLRDAQVGRLPALGLGEYVNYVIFFPAYTAGPIDRAERFVKDLRRPIELGNEDWLDAGTRLILGLFKKFVIADLLAVISVSDLLVQNVRTAGWLWVFVYAYAFRIYFDFSGYTDMAIGLGRLLGIRLPENFDAPYGKQNIALFWNSWHMSLTQWFRAYVFNPLTRFLRTHWPSLPIWIGVLVTQLITMVLIGLWHGITWDFALWGLWHALGLFAHNRWVEFAGSRWPRSAGPGTAKAAGILGVLLTFNFVAVGWLFFALSTPEISWRALRTLVGAA